MSFFLTSDNVKLYYQVQGEGKPVVLIHGWSCSHEHFKNQIDELAKKYQVVAYDLRGHGLSEVPDYGLNIPRFAQDLKELIAFLNLKTVSLVGWSMGTTIIFEYLKQFGQTNLDKLCFIDMTPRIVTDGSWKNGLYGEFPMEANVETLVALNEDWKAFAEGFIPAIFAKSGARDKALEAWALEQAFKNSPNVMTRMWISMSTRNYVDLVPTITLPTLITYGAESCLYTPENSEYMGKKMPNAKVLPFPKCGHALMLEEPKRFTDALISFLA